MLLASLPHLDLLRRGPPAVRSNSAALGRQPQAAPPAV